MRTGWTLRRRCCARRSRVSWDGEDSAVGQDGGRTSLELERIVALIPDATEPMCDPTRNPMCDPTCDPTCDPFGEGADWDLSEPDELPEERTRWCSVCFDCLR